MSYLSEISDRFGYTLDYITDTFNIFSNRAGEDVPRKLQSLEKNHPNQLSFTALMGGNDIFHLPPVEGNPGVSYSTFENAEVSPTMIRLDKTRKNPSYAFEFDDFVLHNAGLRSNGYVCDQAGCLPKAMFTLLDGEHSYKDIKALLKSQEMKNGYPISGYKRYTQHLGHGRMLQPAGSWMAASDVLGKDFITGKRVSTSNDIAKEALSLISERIPNFMVGVDLADRNTIAHHAMSFYKHKPVLDFPEQLATYSANTNIDKYGFNSQPYLYNIDTIKFHKKYDNDFPEKELDALRRRK